MAAGKYEKNGESYEAQRSVQFKEGPVHLNLAEVHPTSTLSGRITKSGRAMTKSGRAITKRVLETDDSAALNSYRAMTQEEREDVPSFLCFGGTNVKNNWDILVGILIMYTAMIVPYRLGFGESAEGAMFWLEMSMDAIFIIDLVVSFNTAFLDNGEWVTDRDQIASRYLRGWFLIDAPASIPVDAIELLVKALQPPVVTGDGGKSPYAAMRLLRLLRLARVIKLMKLGALIDSMEEEFGLNLGWVNVVKMLLTLVYVTHLVGCVWFSVAWLHAQEDNWLSAYAGVPFDEVGIYDRYTFSVYWSLTTLTTVGYGDVLPVNNIERWFTMGVFLIGVMCFGYMMGSIGNIVDSLDKRGELMSDKMLQVKQYVEYRGFPRPLAHRMRQYYDQFYSKSAYLFEEDDLLSLLTPGLRADATTFLLEKIVGTFPFFMSTFDIEFSKAVLTKLQPTRLRKGAVGYTRGAHADGLYFIQHGELGLFLHSFEDAIFHLGPNCSLGEEALRGGKRTFTTKALITSDMLLLPADDMMEVMSEFPETVEIVEKEVLIAAEHRKTFQELMLRLKSVMEYRQGNREEAITLRFQVLWFNHAAHLARREHRDLVAHEEMMVGTTESRLRRVEYKLRALESIPDLAESINSIREDLSLIVAKKKGSTSTVRSTVRQKKMLAPVSV